MVLNLVRFGPLRRQARFAVLAAALTAGACAKQASVEEFVETPAPTLYSEGMNLLDSGSYSDAAKRFEEVDRQHPYSEWAKKSLLMTSFAHFQAGAYDDSVGAAQRYLTLHPGSEDAPYAQYLIAQSHYRQISDIGRDQTQSRKALDAFNEVTRLYPESKYAQDAERRQAELLGHLAGKELEVGRYYLGRQNYLAAVNRFRTVVTDYQTTSHVEEALHRLTEAYYAMGVVSEAQTAAAILGYNYPDSPWYRDAVALLQSGGLSPQEDKGSWISKAVRRVST
jgi:outer membrane protein assembly factor BamD